MGAGVGTPKKLRDINALTPSANDLLVWNGTQWSNRALLAGDIPSLTAVKISDFATAADARISAALGVSVQSYDADLAAIALLAPADGTFIKRAGGVWTAAGIASGDIPDLSGTYAPTSHNHAASAINSGQLVLARGGTGADLSATGAGFLRQASTGANVTVSGIVSADLSTALTTPPAIGGTTPAAGAFTTLAAASSAWAIDANSVIAHTPGNTWLDSDNLVYAHTLTVGDVAKDVQNTGTTTQALDTRYIATKFTAASSYTAQRITFWLKFVAGTTTTVTLKVYSDNAGQPGTLLSTGTAYYHGSLTGSYAETSFSISQAFVSGTTYWLVLDSATALANAEVYIATTAITGMFATSPDASTWTVVNDKQLRFRVFAGQRAGVYGSSTNNIGVYGSSTNNIGVYGTSTNSYGVRGSSTNNYGVYGSSTNNIGVRGTSTNYIGVYGSSTNNIGVYGSTTNNIGVRGSSTNSYGGYFSRNTASPSSAVPVLYVLQDHASDTNPAALICQDGVGNILNLANGADATVRFAFSAAGAMTGVITDAITGGVATQKTIGHALTTANAGADGIGVRVMLAVADSTSAIGGTVDVASIVAKLPTATHLSRTGQLDFSVIDAGGTRLPLSLGANGSAATIGFLGAAPIAKPALGAWVGLTTDQKLDAIRDALSNLGLASYS